MTDAQPTDARMPALYIGHGAPPLLDDALWSGQLAAWSAALARPKAVLIVSAHWESAPVMLSATAPGTPLVYDFGRGSSPAQVRSWPLHTGSSRSGGAPCPM